MRRFWPLLLFAVIFAGVLLRPDSDQPPPMQGSDYRRIISLAPSITETAFALELGDRVVAVTDYCLYPAEACALPKVGGYLDPSLEALIALEPDLVIMLDRQQQLQRQLQRLSIATHTVDNATLAGILSGIGSIGEITGHRRQAQALLTDIRQQIEQIKKRVLAQPPTRALVAIAHYAKADQLDTVYIAGQHDFYNDLLEIAGGVNVYRDQLIKVPALSREGIMRLDPDVIIDLIPATDDQETDMEQARQHWQSLAQISAVRTGRVHLIHQDYASIPGPRIFRLLPEFANLLHPELHGTDAKSDD
jgi:iron complex transport system substrate-binding protein